jgi:hypothetical protein
MVNYYHRLLPRIASTPQPLTDLFRGNPKTLEWTASAADAFTAAKAALVAAVPLSHPATGTTLALAVERIRFACRRRSPAAGKQGMASIGLFLTKIDANPGLLLQV